MTNDQEKDPAELQAQYKNYLDKNKNCKVRVVKAKKAECEQMYGDLRVTGHKNLHKHAKTVKR